ncbi:MAG: hypothetical protein AAFW83_00890 [Pseudomonadota bacterium]
MSSPPPDIDQALADLSSIREQVAAGSLFQGFGPLVIAGTGVLALVAMTIQNVRPGFAASAEAYLATWIATAVLCCLMVGAEMVARSRRHHGGMADAMILRAIEQFLQVGLAGAAITFVFWRFAPDTVWTLPGLWQILVGVGVFASLRTLPRSMMLVGIWYFLAGATTIVIAAKTRTLHPAMMGLPFFVGQSVMAVVLKTASGENRVETL